jgi:hypothetical protein
MTWQAFFAAAVVLGIPVAVLNITDTNSIVAFIVLLIAFAAALGVYAAINGATAVPRKGPYA